MSIADMQKPAYLSRNSLSMSSSLSDLVGGSPFDLSSAADNVLTIEELRAHMGSCFTCGVSWTDDHVSLDCSECGGYSNQRPCPLCDGKCTNVWKRDFSMSHACGKARWQGHCASYPDSHSNTSNSSLNPHPVQHHLHQHHHHHQHNLPTVSSALNQSQTQTCGASQFLAHELCARLEQLSASAQT